MTFCFTWAYAESYLLQLYIYYCRVFVGNRLGKCKVEAKGIFAGAQVMRGPDWDWGNQDGGPQSVGQVLDVRGWELESFRSVACVKWKPTSTNVYRVGHKGKVGKFNLAIFVLNKVRLALACVACTQASSPGRRIFGW